MLCFFVPDAADQGIGVAILVAIIAVAGIGIGVLFLTKGNNKSMFVIISDEGINVANKVILSFSDIIDAFEEEVVTRSRGITIKKMHVFAKYFDSSKNKEVKASLFNEDFEGYPYMREKVLKNFKG
jgi:UTP-glucose-1-phosphate uridylyltransferase